MADIDDRLGRLHRREELTRRAVQPVLPEVPGVPAGGVDPGFAEVLEAVGRVVRRWPGVTVMVAAEGRPGRPVIRLSERDGDVDAAVVGRHVGPPGPTAEPGPAHPEPGSADPGYARPGRLERTYPATDHGDAGPARPAHAGPGYDDPGPADADNAAAGHAGHGDAGHAGPGYGHAGRAGPDHAGSRYPGPGYSDPGPADASRAGPGYGDAGPAGADRADAGHAGYGDARPAGPGHADPRDADAGNAGPGHGDAGHQPEREPDRQEPDGRPGLWLVPHLPPGRHASRDEDDRPAGGDEGAPGGRVEPPAATSEVVARLAQLLREDPSLAATWGREARES